MAARGLRSVLQPILFVGIASMLHGILFLIPSWGPGKSDSETSRGVRVKTYVEGPRAATPSPPPAPRAPEPAADRAIPSVPSDKGHSMTGADAARAGADRGGGRGDEGGPYGVSGPSQGPGVGSGGPVTQSEFGQYLAHLRSDDVQGWARRSAKASRQGWKGSAAGSGGWAAEAGTGTGSGAGSGKGSARGRGRGAGDAILDPRVRMVVIQYPINESGRTDMDKGRNIENRVRPVPYPDLKIKQSNFTSGWWQVYIELWTTKEGQVAKYDVKRPETDGPLERIFVNQVKGEMAHWTFEPGASEIHVDVRFHVE